MTKDEILTDVDDLIKSLMDTGPMGQVYNDGFKDGAKYVLQKLQQTQCTTLLPPADERAAADRYCRDCNSEKVSFVAFHLNAEVWKCKDCRMHSLFKR